MKIIVTGAGGFVGHHLVRKLLARGDDVVGIDSVAGGIAAKAQSVIGDLGDKAVRMEAIAGGCDALIHLATVPGGAAEADPAGSRRINIDAMYDLLEEVAEAGQCPRVVFASSIAVYGDPFPPAGVDDSTPLSPKMIYGGHKAMMETAIAMFSNRGMIDGVSLRLPGILARPKGPSGMKSAFMSNLFHALKAGEAFICPVSPEATIWAQSVDRCADNFVHALSVDRQCLPRTRAVTLPALTISMRALIDEIALACGVSASLVSHQQDLELEQAFGSHPPLTTLAAESAGFTHDGSVATLVQNALKTLA